MFRFSAKCSAELILRLVGSVTAQFSPTTAWAAKEQAARVDHANLYVQLLVTDSNSGNVFCETITKSHTRDMLYKFDLSNLTNNKQSLTENDTVQ